MEAIQATDVLIYIRNNNDTSLADLILACMQNAVINIDNQFLDITTKGDGKVGGLLQSGYSATLQGSGVIEANVGDTMISGPALLRPTLEGSTCLITYTVGSLEMHVNAKILNLSYQSNIGSLWKFSATFQFTSEIITNELYDLTNYYTISANSFRRVSTTTETEFTDSSLIGLRYFGGVKFILAKNGIRQTNILPAGIDFSGNDDTEIIYTNDLGRFEFATPLVSGDVILILYY